jgi:hypothetical protein
VFANRRGNRGFESLTLSADRSVMWTANEEALTVDGPVSSPTVGTLVRLQSYVPLGAGYTPGVQHAYRVEPMHGAAISGGQSGLSELALLPQGAGLLAMERSFALSGLGVYLTRMYLVDFTGASDTRNTPSITSSGVVRVGKRLIYSGSHNNLEGLAVGPMVTSSGPLKSYFMVGVLDDGDPITNNDALGFLLTIRGCMADYNEDGGVDGVDVAAFFDDWVLGSAGADANDDGGTDGADVEVFFAAWVAGGC